MFTRKSKTTRAKNAARKYVKVKAVGKTTKWAAIVAAVKGAPKAAKLAVFGGAAGTAAAVAAKRHKSQAPSAT